MAETKGHEVTTFNITKEALRELLTEIAGQARRMTPLEQRRYEEELEAERRRAQMMLELGRAEEEALKRKRNACSHKRSKSEGNSVPKSDPDGVWCTQGQVHGDDSVSLICMRCATTWRWQADAKLRQYALDAEHGLLGFPPPPDGLEGVIVS